MLGPFKIDATRGVSSGKTGHTASRELPVPLAGGEKESRPRRIEVATVDISKNVNVKKERNTGFTRGAPKSGSTHSHHSTWNGKKIDRVTDVKRADRGVHVASVATRRVTPVAPRQSHYAFGTGERILSVSERKSFKAKTLAVEARTFWGLNGSNGEATGTDDLDHARPRRAVLNNRGNGGRSKLQQQALPNHDGMLAAARFFSPEIPVNEPPDDGWYHPLVVRVSRDARMYRNGVDAVPDCFSAMPTLGDVWNGVHQFLSSLARLDCVRIPPNEPRTLDDDPGPGVGIPGQEHARAPGVEDPNVHLMVFGDMVEDPVVVDGAGRDILPGDLGEDQVAAVMRRLGHAVQAAGNPADEAAGGLEDVPPPALDERHGHFDPGLGSGDDSDRGARRKPGVHPATYFRTEDVRIYVSDLTPGEFEWWYDTRTFLLRHAMRVPVLSRLVEAYHFDLIRGEAGDDPTALGMHAQDYRGSAYRDHFSSTGQLVIDLGGFRGVRVATIYQYVAKLVLSEHIGVTPGERTFQFMLANVLNAFPPNRISEVNMLWAFNTAEYVTQSIGQVFARTRPTRLMIPKPGIDERGPFPAITRS